MGTIASRRLRQLRRLCGVRLDRRRLANRRVATRARRCAVCSRRRRQARKTSPRRIGVRVRAPSSVRRPAASCRLSPTSQSRVPTVRYRTCARRWTRSQARQQAQLQFSARRATRAAHAPRCRPPSGAPAQRAVTRTQSATRALERARSAAHSNALVCFGSTGVLHALDLVELHAERMNSRTVDHIERQHQQPEPAKSKHQHLCARYCSCSLLEPLVFCAKTTHCLERRTASNKQAG